LRKNNYRNIAIIAHVDHGKTTLVDGMLRYAGQFRENEEVIDRVMDNMDLERERGITITAKNTAVNYNNTKINIVDTPGHADFGGEVERSLNLVDGVLLLVDSSEGPLPQTRFVLKKALEKKLPVILIVNKIDRKDARIKEVINEVYDLFIDLGANDQQIDFLILYTNAKKGIAHLAINDNSVDLKPLFNAIITEIPGPIADDSKPPKLLVTNLDYDAYVGQIVVGRLSDGILEMNKRYSHCNEFGIKSGIKFSACYTYDGLRKIKVKRVEAGDIIAIAGVDDVKIGDTITSEENPVPLPRIEIDKPTVSMQFCVNNGPFSGKEGEFLTSRHLKDRLYKETLLNVSLNVKSTSNADTFEVCGRGELQLAVLIETMRREGFELLVSKPQVITKENDGILSEPMEHVFIDIPENNVGIITERLSQRKGRMINMKNNGYGRVNMEFKIPSRGLIGFRSQFLTDTKGAGIMNSLFSGFSPWFGDISQRTNGAIISDRDGKVTRYACLGMLDRGELFIDIGTPVYKGMIIGERNREGDLEVNITREKKLTNMRSSTSEATVTLRTYKKLSLDQSIEFISDDEYVEVTPENIRLRKMELDSNKRASIKKKQKLRKS